MPLYQATLNIDNDTYYTLGVIYDEATKLFRVIQRLYYNGRLETTKPIGAPMAVLMDAVSVVGSIIDNQSEVTI